MATMRNPQAWYGKPAKTAPQWGHLEIDKCDDCQRLFHPDNLHALLWPQCEADRELQKALRVEEAQGFCPDCLMRIEAEADKIDPEWRKRQFGQY